MSELAQPLIDPSIETLSEVLDPVALAKHLRGVRLGPRIGRTIHDVQVRLLRHHAGRRCTLEIGLQTEGGWHFVIGKVYQVDCPEVFQAMEGIQQAGFGPRDEYSIPQPLAYLASLRFLLQEQVEGPSAGEVFKIDDEQNRVAAAERCARWLARFHAVGPKFGPVCYPHEHLKSKSMRRCARRITRLSGAIAKKAGRLLQRLEETSSSLCPVELRAGHGSYSASHVILAEGRTVAIDWDFHEVTDPACDVARFLGALRRRALIRLGSIRLLDGAAEAFLRAYLASGPSEVEENLRFFEAATYLNLAIRHLSDPGPNCQENTEVMLDEGLRVLGQEVFW